MRKWLSLFMALIMLFTCAFSATAEKADALKAEEMESVIRWLSDQTSGDEARHMLVWDRETILEKLAGYDGPLNYITKEEAADVVMQVLSMYSLYTWLGQTEDLDPTLMGLYGVYTDETSETEGQDPLSGMLDGLMNVSNEEGETVNRLLGVFSEQIEQTEQIGQGDSEMASAMPDNADETTDGGAAPSFGKFWKSIEKKVTEAAEEIEVLKTEEMEKVILWLSDQTSGDEAAHMLAWDRDTILKKLEGYDEPLTYVTKEEAADVVMQVLSMYSLYAWLGKTEGMDLTLKGLYGVYINEAKVEGTEGDEGDNLAGILDSLTSVSNEEGETVNRLLGVLSEQIEQTEQTEQIEQIEQTAPIEPMTQQGSETAPAMLDDADKTTDERETASETPMGESGEKSKAETSEDPKALKTEELEKVIQWLSDHTSGDEAAHMLVWDRDTILEKLEGYDEPLTYVTKEEAADVVMQVLSMYSLYAWLGKTEGIDLTLKGLYGVYTNEAQVEGAEGEEGDNLAGILDSLTSVSNEEGETVNRLLGVLSEQIEQTEQTAPIAPTAPTAPTEPMNLQGSETASPMLDDADKTTDEREAASDAPMGENSEKNKTGTSEDPDTLKAEELEKVIQWLSDQTSGDEAAHMMAWGRNTILEKLKGYDEPLTYVTKEEAADVVMQVLSMYSLNAWLGKTEGKDLTLKGLYGVYTNEAQAGDTEEEGQANLAEILDSLTSVSNEEGETVNRLLGVLSDLQSDRDDTDDEAVSLFDGTYWKSGETVMKAVFQKGHYRVVLVQGASEWSYQCEFHEYKRDGTLFCSLTSTGTGDEFRDAQQPDHGVAVFEYSPITETLTWQQADGGEVMLTQIMDPLYEE